MSNNPPIVRGYAIYPEQDLVVRDYARRRCGGNISLAIRTMIDHFAACPEALSTEPRIVDPNRQPNLEPAA